MLEERFYAALPFLFVCPAMLYEGMQLGFVVPSMKEAMGLVQILERPVESSRHGRRLRKGQISGHDCAIIISGCGKIASAAATQSLIDNEHPDLLFHFGTAGAISDRLRIGDFVIADEIIEHDFISHFGRGKGRVPKISPSIELASKIEAYAASLSRSYLRGRILSGNEDVVTTSRRDELLKKYSGDAVDWESAGFAQVAAAAKRQHAIVRVISDYAYENTDAEFMANVHAISRDLGGFLAGFLSTI